MTRFRARARAVDMLGRQQIRGVGTALSELFKNAHDAYATDARIDFFRDRSALVLRDNGIGMSEDDFVERWLTLGTESKIAETGGLKLPDPPPRIPQRTMLGEKGIGRLAIAAVGSQVLVLTRAQAAGSPVVAAFLNWDLFALPGVNLDQVDVPMITLRSTGAPAAADLSELIETATASLEQLKMSSERRERIAAEIRSFPIDLFDLIARLEGPNLESAGTQFLVAPTDDSLLDGLQQDPGEDISELQSALIGFANPLVSKPVMRTSFWDRPGPGQAREVISQEFWNRKDLGDADHEVQGRFDEFGTFEGRVRVYEKERDHRFTRSGPPGTLRAGPFSIHFGYLQGRQSQSRAAPDRYAELERKANAIAGLYVYRDGIRIQPYGDHRFDWLDIERNRTKSASFYFFSYRRIFGFVALDRAHNAALTEKAGREGFRENPAYREFRELLGGFFVHLAAEFFRLGGQNAVYFLERRSQLKREELARRAREDRLNKARRRFAVSLHRHQQALRRGTTSRAIQRILRKTTKELASASSASAVAEIATRAGVALHDIRASASLSAPRTFALPEELRFDFDAYKADWRAIEEELAEAQATVRGAAASALAGRSSDTEPAHEEAAEPTSLDTTIFASERATGLQDAAAAAAATRKSAASLVQRTDRILADLEGELNSFVPSEDLESSTKAWRTLVEGNLRLLESLAAEIDLVDVIAGADGTLLASGELAGAADAELLSIRDQLERDLELAQLGLAVEVVGHEFRGTVAAIRGGLDRLEAFARRNPELASLHRELTAAFEHLDNYLTLFAPLQRRVRVEPTELVGSEIYRFLSELFADRVKASGLDFDTTDDFSKYRFMGRPAVFYPVLINLVDNAAFWLADAKAPRMIRLDRRDTTLIVEDSGPGIAKRDRQAVFEAGFTRKPAGRGLGLYISRQVLERNGYEISVTSSTLGGARFEIAPKPEEDDEDA